MYNVARTFFSGPTRVCPACGPRPAQPSNEMGATLVVERSMHDGLFSLANMAKPDYFSSTRHTIETSHSSASPATSDSNTVPVAAFSPPPHPSPFSVAVTPVPAPAPILPVVRIAPAPPTTTAAASTATTAANTTTYTNDCDYTRHKLSELCTDDPLRINDTLRHGHLLNTAPVITGRNGTYAFLDIIENGIRSALGSYQGPKNTAQALQARLGGVTWGIRRPWRDFEVVRGRTSLGTLADLRCEMHQNL